MAYYYKYNIADLAGFYYSRICRPRHLFPRKMFSPSVIIYGMIKTRDRKRIPAMNCNEKGVIMKKSIICILCFVLLVAMILAPAAYGYQSPEPTEEQLALVESQSIGLTGVTNARQLGGYVTEDGRKVKDGVLIRSGALGTATEEDIRILTEDYNVKLIIDFRNE